MTLARDGNITLSYSYNNQEPKKQLYGKLKSMLGHLGMHPDHLLPRTGYLKNEIPIAGVAHQAGTVRFGSDPAMSVLDVTCKTHDVDNLYVVDTSFFPSIGAVNPALTAIANAFRVGDHLLERMGAEGRPAGSRSASARGTTEMSGLMVKAHGQSSKIGVVYAPVWSRGRPRGVPRSSAILTSPSYYGRRPYGALFLPQAVAAILAALSGASLIRRVGIKRTFLAGLVGDVVAMSLLVASQFFIGQGSIPYAMLLMATTSLGIGFGLTVPAINTFAAAFAPAAADRAVLYLNALLGLGTALAPVLVAVFVGIGFW